MNDRTSDPLQIPDRWQNITPSPIATQHIQACNAEINGYWDEDDRFYETIRFSQSPTPEVISSSLGVTPNHNGGTPCFISVGAIAPRPDRPQGHPFACPRMSAHRYFTQEFTGKPQSPLCHLR